MTGVVPVPGQPEIDCSTCLEKLTDDVVQMVKCGHTFHCTCILAWFQSNNSRRGACPNCRTELFEPAPLHAPRQRPVYTTQYGPPQGFGRGGPLTPPGPRAGLSRLFNPSARTFFDPHQQRAIRLAADEQVRSAEVEMEDQLRRLREQFAANPDLAFEPPRPSAENTLPNNEPLRPWHERERILGPTSERPRPANARDVQSTVQQSRDNSVPSALREALASIETEHLEMLVRREHPSARLRSAYEAELTRRRGEPDLYASPTAQVFQSESQSARSSGSVFVPHTARHTRPAVGARMHMGQTPVFGSVLNYPPSWAQLRAEQEAEGDRWQESLMQFHDEQATVAAQDPSMTLYSFARPPTTEMQHTPAIRPPALRTPLGGPERVSGPGHSRWAERRRSDLRIDPEAAPSRPSLAQQRPPPAGLHGVHPGNLVNETFPELLARQGLVAPATHMVVPQVLADASTPAMQAAEDQDVGSEESVSSTAVNFFNLSRDWSGRS